MNTKKFNEKSEMYQKFRPSYPKAFIAYLYQQLGVQEHHSIADIGSGTGILTEQLLHKGNKVIAVEPNEEMRLSVEKRLKHHPKFISINATAEQSSISEHSIDFITVAQAFHWFDHDKFKIECQRILKRDGKVILVWNNRVEDDPIVIANRSLCETFCEGFTGFSGKSEEERAELTAFFKKGEFEEQSFDNHIVCNLDGFIGRNLSASYAPKPTDANYKPFVMALTQLFYTHSVDGVITLPNITTSYVGKV
ncbi:class I SAM-dependent methyltransferase [Longirhabdus pacifica]|uniref:class I SAM-dependent methyltransferase n=1 Tax=Longirhabdus pacifica TaxID=2305227 RepID=UPI0010089EAB|nr:class I SAM-dependent methyltransferase [Longirhabdus pacifica]